MKMPMTLMGGRRAQMTSAIATHQLIEHAVMRRTSDSLRVLAYHDVNDPDAFEAQLRHLVRYYRVVGEDDVAAVRRDDPFPDRWVWLTFDDALPGVIEHALPLLDRFGVTATLFVCPGVVDTAVPYWWQAVASACQGDIDERIVTGASGDAAVRILKRWPDEVRRAQVGVLSERHAARAGRSPSHRQITSGEIRRWIGAGHRVGSHTWDHPCLDTCTVEAQQRQICEAHDRLVEITGDKVRSFAYPNGNWTAWAETALRDLGYDLGVLFDHQLAGPHQDRLRLSRVRVSAGAGVDRFRALVSGAHVALYQAAWWRR